MAPAMTPRPVVKRAFTSTQCSTPETRWTGGKIRRPVPLAVMFAAKFGVDVATAQSWGGMFVPGLECLANLAMGGLSGFSLWRSVSGANANTKAIQAQNAS